MAQAQSPHERDDHSLAKMKSTEEGHGTRREGRFRRAISRMVKSQTSSSPESEQGHPVHQPVHPHSRNTDQTSDGEETAVTEPPTGPFSASAENGYRPTSRTSVPNPYTTRSLDVDDVDTGANPVGQWRGVGLDEPEPRSPHTPATTDTMTDNPTPESPAMPGSTERPEAPVPPAAQASPDPEPAAEHRPAPGQRTAHEPQRPQTQLPEPQGQSHEFQPHQPQPQWPAAEPALPGKHGEPQQAHHEPRRYADRPQNPYEPAHPDRPRTQAPERGQDHRAPHGHQGHQAPNGHRDHSGHQPAYQEAPGYQGQGYQGQGHPGPGGSGQGYPADQRGPQHPVDQHPVDQHPADPYSGHQQPGHQQPRDQFSGHQYQGSPYPENQQGRPGRAAHSADPRGYQGQQGHVYQGQPPAPYPYPQAEYPPQPPVPPAPQVQHYPVHYAHPQPMPYQSAYPLPYQPPGYVLPGQPVIYPGQFGAYGQPAPYGQPVQHVIVLAAGQQPQVVTAESAATLFAERSEPTVSRDVPQDKALTRSAPDEEADPERSPGTDRTPEQAEPVAVDAPSAEQPVREAEEDSTAEEVREAAAAVRAGAAAAVSGALPEAEPDSSGELLNEALAGLAMRDLSLVDALLETVEALETDAQDPDLLDKLFQIDNFATRMRRNGENFLVLTGHDGGESDAHDEIVPLLDVARAATSEIKDYPRVSLGKLPQTSITGLAADDISHLLAELLDNATANSPEHSQVVISARELEDGRLMIVVEDEGVGIPEDQLAELNGRLSGEPVLDDEVPKHMGLYVASRIAQKHGLETRLESRSFRGLSAYTIIPAGLLRVATPRQPGQTRTSTIPSASAPVTTTGPIPQQPANGKPVNGGASGRRANGSGPAGSAGSKTAQPASEGGTSAVTAAGLPRRSATPHGSPLRMMPHPGALSENPPPPPEGREDTPPKLTGQARAEQIRDELGDFLDGERAALEGEELEGDKE